ncbi:CDP-glucose 4,6-dehydratase [Aliiglaciecola sp.]|nr:CDP-glucose 4,6-dehydratase [Aliiglaciecola sp.]
MDINFWKGKRVLITGHTGFKGSWLCLWLKSLGAEISGYALSPNLTHNLFDAAQIRNDITHHVGNLADPKFLQDCINQQRPQIVFHLAAQAIVRESYESPKQTYETNVMGTLNLLEACRNCKSIKAMVIVSTDKCYENKEWHWGYRESDELGGHDPYSSSKACMEILISSYRRSYFSGDFDAQKKLAIATARAGNVIGGGDWAKDRLVPDILDAIKKKSSISLRYPYSIRPWQHVLEPLSGYINLAEKLYSDGTEYAKAWNFGPEDESAKTVRWITDFVIKNYPSDIKIIEDERDSPHEAKYLKLDCSQSKNSLNWRAKWDLESALLKVIEWSKSTQQDEHPRAVCLRQIAAYESS